MRLSAFHRRVRLRMQQLGMRPADLARAWRRPHSRVSEMLEKGRWPGGEDLLRLPEALGCNPLWLFYDHGEPDEAPGEGFAEGVQHERSRIMKAIRNGK